VDGLPYGVTRYRLVVFPPGITPGARVRVRAWRAWPVVGAVVATTAALAASWLVSPVLAVATGGLAYLAGFAALGRAALPERRAVRQIWAEDPGEAADLDDLLGPAHVRVLAELMCAADEAVADGELTGPEYRDVWRCVYDEVSALLAVHPERVELAAGA